MSNFFSESFTTSINKIIEEQRYNLIKEGFLNQIFTKSVREVAFLQDVISNSIYYKNRNFITFVQFLDCIYEMLDIADTNTPPATRLLNIDQAINKGDSVMLQECYSLLEQTNQTYDITIQTLIKSYKDQLTKNSNQSLVCKESKINARQTNTITQDKVTKDNVTIIRGYCDKCGFNHPLPCDGRKQKREALRRKDYKDKIDQRSSNNDKDQKRKRDDETNATVAELYKRIEELEGHSKANQTKRAKKNLISNDEDSKGSSDDEPDNHTHKSRQITYRNIRHYLSQMRTRHVDNMPERKHHAYYGKTCSDSGASVTMTPNVNLVSNFVPSTEKIYLPNGDVIYTIGKGMLGPLTDVLVAPDLEDTLVSVSQFDKLGFSTLYGNDQVKIFEGYALDDDSELIAVGQRLNDNLYFFDKDEDFLPKKNHLRVITRTGAGESRNDHPNNLQLEEKKRKLIYLDPVIHQSTKRNTITSEEVIVDLNDHKNSTLNDSDHDNDEENNVIENETLVYEPERINSRSSKQSKLDDLHYITGLSKKKLVEALQHNAFTGITLTGEQCKGLNMTNSDAYYEGHYKAKSLPRINDMDTRSPCDVIAGDILAKFKVPNKKKE